MLIVLLVIHLMIGLALVGVILIQRNDASGMGGLGGGTMGGFMTTRGAANLLTRTTAILAALFMATSILLTLSAKQSSTPLFQDQNVVPTTTITKETLTTTEKTNEEQKTGEHK